MNSSLILSLSHFAKKIQLTFGDAAAHLQKMIRVIFMVASLKCRWCVCGYTCFAKYTYTSTGRASSLIDHRCKILKSQTALISLVGTHMCFRSTNLQQLLPLSCHITFFQGENYGMVLFFFMETYFDPFVVVK